MTYSTLEEQQLGKLWELYLSFRDSGDERGARRLFKLLEKRARQWQAACFCGHFSAGKSTLLNTLLSEDLLPTSPIPTSGNLVRLEPGKESVRVVYKNGESMVMDPPYDLSKLQDWCKNTEEIDEVRIHMGDTFPSNWTLFDTPGIDATDRDHQAATEDAVFLADAVVFVSDYNHIQSEANFEFLDRVQRLGRPIYLVVNQIDKHQEDEIPFEAYAARIDASLKEWGVQVERIFYLSLMDLEHPHNDWELFKSFMTQLSKAGTEEATLEPVLEALINDHKDWWKHTHEVSLPEDVLETLNAEVHQLREEVETLEKEAEVTSTQEWVEQVRSDINRTIESAVLTPYETRDLAKAYLESVQSDFKVGFFSTQSKVQKARDERLQALLQDLNERVQTLNWQTSDSFYKVLEPFYPQKNELKRMSQRLSVKVDEALIKKQMSEGASLTGTYLLNFADKLSSSIQKDMRLQVKDLLDDILSELDTSFAEQQGKTTRELDEQREKLALYERALKIKRQERHHFGQLESITQASIELTDTMQHEIEKTVTSPPKFNVLSLNEQLAETKIEQKSQPVEELGTFSIEEELGETLNASQLKDATQTIKQAKGFEKTATLLLERLDRLENRTLTVALFGAFSAGKSSFANALLGESALKVSPHPTTAVVNRILPVDDAHAHGHMVLFMKSEEALLQDVQRALKPFGKSVDSLDDLDKAIRSLPSLGAGYSKAKLYLAFLQAVTVGLKNVRHQLGQEVVVDMVDGHEIVADETKACLIDRVDLYFDCEATRKGMILVDTPGADSLNARHTETSYKYIQSADAIVFVTYYQHAFSRADETFLRQMGRIQDAFDRDKFFFIVNAIDLARNEDEKRQVTGYVTQQLKQLGLSSPRLFGVSSLNALKAKKQGDENLLRSSGFAGFMEDWTHFVEHDLIQQTLRSTQSDLTQSVELLDDFIEKSQMTDDEREQALNQLKSDVEEAIQTVSQTSTSWTNEELNQTVDELFYYVKQRTSLQLNENFSKFFNPAVLRQDSGSKQMALKACLEECLTYLSNELEQEIHSTAIRVEASLSKMLKTYREHMNQALSKQWQLHEQDSYSWTSASTPYDFIEIPREPLEKTFKLYKNPKQFFEENGIKQFKEALLNELSPALTSYVEAAIEQFKSTYQDQLSMALPTYEKTAVDELSALHEQKHESIREAKERQASYLSIREQLQTLGI